jgi:hypothetical protein
VLHLLRSERPIGSWKLLILNLPFQVQPPDIKFVAMIWLAEACVASAVTAVLFGYPFDASLLVYSPAAQYPGSRAVTGGTCATEHTLVLRGTQHPCSTFGSIWQP